ncbi:MAG: signal peptidase I [Proteobacteria bacterium]|nr:signal peptidase I [Pseudomonadota bacterium]
MDKKKSVIREYVEAILIAVVLAMFIRSFIVQAFKIPSGSMEPTLLIGDHILVNKFIYGITVPFTHKKLFQWKNPQREDVIVFVYPVDESKDFIKRVIGVGGDRIEIKQKKIYINDQPFNDTHGHYQESNPSSSYIQFRDNLGPIVVPENTLFVMGDNRDRSYDSRFWGFVTLDRVKGKAFMIYWSWGSFLRDIRWVRIGNFIY